MLGTALPHRPFVEWIGGEKGNYAPAVQVADLHPPTDIEHTLATARASAASEATVEVALALGLLLTMVLVVWLYFALRKARRTHKYNTATIIRLQYERVANLERIQELSQPLCSGVGSVPRAVASLPSAVAPAAANGSSLIVDDLADAAAFDWQGTDEDALERARREAASARERLRVCLEDGISASRSVVAVEPPVAAQPASNGFLVSCPPRRLVR